MILNANQRRSLERALSLANSKEDALSYMEKIASVAPPYAERVRGLRDRQKYIIELAKIALTADSSTGG